MFWAWAKFSIWVSRIVAGSGVPAAADIEEQKKNRAGFLVFTDKHIWRKLWAPCMCCSSKLWTPMLKFTAQALWMTVVTESKSSENISLPTPRSFLLNSPGSALILANSLAESARFRVFSDARTLLTASSLEEARTRHTTFLTLSRGRS